MTMKIGDIVMCPRDKDDWVKGLIIGFGLKGEGGKDYVHVLIDGNVETYMRFNLQELTDEDW